MSLSRRRSRGESGKQPTAWLSRSVPWPAAAGHGTSVLFGGVLAARVTGFRDAGEASAVDCVAVGAYGGAWLTARPPISARTGAPRAGARLRAGRQGGDRRERSLTKSEDTWARAL